MRGKMFKSGEKTGKCVLLLTFGQKLINESGCGRRRKAPVTLYLYTHYHTLYTALDNPIY